MVYKCYNAVDPWDSCSIWSMSDLTVTAPSCQCWESFIPPIWIYYLPISMPRIINMTIYVKTVQNVKITYMYLENTHKASSYATYFSGILLKTNIWFKCFAGHYWQIKTITFRIFALAERLFTVLLVGVLVLDYTSYIVLHTYNLLHVSFKASFSFHKLIPKNTQMTTLY